MLRSPILDRHYPPEAKAFARGYNRFLLLWLGWCLLMAGVFAIIYYNTLWPVPEGFFYDPNRWRLPRWNAQVALGRGLLGLWLAPVAVAVWLKWHEFVAYLKRWWTEPGSPYVLASMRLLFMWFMIVVFVGAPYEQSGLYAEQPAKNLVAPPGAEWWVQALPVNPELYALAQWIGCATALLATIGLFTPWALGLNVLAGFYFFGLPNLFGNLTHTHLFVWFPLLLALSPCHRVWSLDALIRKKRGKMNLDWLEELIKAGQALKLMQLLVAVIFFWAGFYKLWASGLDWAYSHSALNQIYLQWAENKDYRPDVRLDTLPGFYQAGALLIVLFELSFPLLLFSRAGRATAFLSSQLFHLHNAIYLSIWFMQLHLLAFSFIGHFSLLFDSHQRRLIKNLLPINFNPKGRHRFHMALGMAFICINALFGFFQAHSWPFSAFPSYTILVGDYGEEVRLYGKDGAKKVDFTQLWRSDTTSLFLSENLTNYSRPLITNWAKADTNSASKQAKYIVQSWKAGVEGCAEFDTVELRWQRFPLQPELRNNLTHDELIGRCWADTCWIAPPPAYAVPHGPGR